MHVTGYSAERDTKQISKPDLRRNRRWERGEQREEGGTDKQGVQRGGKERQRQMWLGVGGGEGRANRPINN